MAFLFQILLERRADPNRKNKFGMTPLQHAAVAGSADVILALLKGGAKANIPDDQKRTPLHWTAGIYVQGTLPILVQCKTVLNYTEVKQR